MHVNGMGANARVFTERGPDQSAAHEPGQVQMEDQYVLVAENDPEPCKEKFKIEGELGARVGKIGGDIRVSYEREDVCHDKPDKPEKSAWDHVREAATPKKGD